ncbi:MAG TPA: thioredoxin-dependent thiol peroxidase [Bacteroidales bacterium]|nr:thioredoxin-dependent thiol peroxidase [Bacteroidales bacterium]HRZ48138.1 thioredoxin-dependent thiol peroxidase [Bacteroidales bacterium]
MNTLSPGDKAPEFTGTDQSGNTVRLSDFSGSKLIVYFYPKDNTPGCTAEACNLRDNYSLLMEKGFRIVGVSADSVKSHKGFAEKFDLPFPLIADTEKQIIKAFGIWGPKKFMGRTFDGIHRYTFVIDGNGVVEKVFDKVDTKNHTEQILKEYKL